MKDNLINKLAPIKAFEGSKNVEFSGIDEKTNYHKRNNGCRKNNNMQIAI